jgi:uncharacterized protein YyaL (SSP411 family)
MTEPGNQLRHARSPYLLQHADNPVAWRPWGEAALAEARASGRPILLSIGYAACHWCHVMAHESFEDPRIAAVINRAFVPIKVDREERPDIDHLYMQALHAMGEQGGWPLTMFLTPDGAPFWGGTYFPPEPRWGKPSFRQVLEALALAWEKDRAAIAQSAASLTRALAAMARAHPGGGIAPDTIARAGAQLLAACDPLEGGLKGAPKFPNAPIFRFLWQQGMIGAAPESIAAVALLLRKLAQGGIHDHLGGGFARYATDAVWLVPHFEKMLYDNAQILELLSFAAARARDPLFAEAAAGIVAWLGRDMKVAMPGGHAFAASEDADSEGEEGKFYVWREGEIDAVLGADSGDFKTAYDVTAAGNWEGQTILRRVTGCGDDAAESRLAAARERLRAHRAGRIRPARDDKVLADWNALMIAALARAAGIFRQPDWLAEAKSVYRVLAASLAGPDGRIAHAWGAGEIFAAGLLDDQAAMARAALALFEATGDPAYQADAERLAEAALHWFGDGAGAFYATAADATDVPLGAEARPRIVADNATPSGNGLMAEVFARLYHITGEPVWRARAEAVLAAFSGREEMLQACPTLLAAATLLAEGGTIVVTGAAADPASAALLAAARASPDPTLAVLTVGPETKLPPAHPAAGKTGDKAAAILCRRQTCALPVTTPEALSALIVG